MTDYYDILPKSDANNSNPSIKRRVRIFYLISGSICVLLSLLRFVIIYKYVDTETGLYAVDSGMLPVIFDYTIYALMGLCLIGSRFAYRKVYAFENVAGTQSYLFSCALCGFILIAAFVLQLISYFDFLSMNSFNIAYTIRSVLQQSVLEFFLWIFTFPCAVYFFKGVSRVSPSTKQGDNKPIVPKAITRKKDIIYSLFSFTPIIWILLRLASCFFDTKQLVNTSGHKLELLLLVFLLLFFLTDARMIIGDTSAAPFFFFGCASVIMVFVSAIPNLVLSWVWMLKTHTSVIIYAVEIAFMVYIMARLYSQFRYSVYSDYETDEIKKARDQMKKNL